MKKILKNSIFTFIVGFFLAVTLTVGAVNLIYSKDVTYDNSLSGLKSTTVQGALDELYEKAKNGGASVSCNENGECTVTCKTGNPTISDNGYSCLTTVKCPNGQIFSKTDNGYKCFTFPINETIVTSGDGLYEDSAEKGRYYYRGTTPKNYITFNNETWRIISVESDGTLKIIRNEQLSETKEWDKAGNRNSGASTFCLNPSSFGCNVWAATKNLINEPQSITYYYPNANAGDSTKYTGTVENNSTLATYLSETYYNSLSASAKVQIVKGTFNVSTPGTYHDIENLEIDAKQEAQYQWKSLYSY